MSANLSDAMRAFVDEARVASIETEIARRGLGLKRVGGELVGPCPVCGGVDRFGVNLRKGIFNCRGSGTGGDVIALVEYLDATDFRGACETLVGRPAPTGASRGPDPEELARREALRLAAEAERERGERDYREEERARMRRVWKEARPIAEGSPVALYLARRGLTLFPDAALRGHAGLGYFHDGAEIGRFPAMIAAMVDGDGVFRGAHVTWIDPVTFGKAEIFDPATGEVLPAKKVRGTMRGSHIALSQHARRSLDGEKLPPIRRLVIGEGIETVLSVRLAMAAVHGQAYDAESFYWSGIALGNLGGKATETIPHPSLVTIDKRGARRKVRAQGPVPLDEPGRTALMPPDDVTEVILLGDGDSERFATEMHLLRAAARWRRPGRRIRHAWAGEGLDFNALLVAGLL